MRVTIHGFLWPFSYHANNRIRSSRSFNQAPLTTKQSPATWRIDFLCSCDWLLL